MEQVKAHPSGHQQAAGSDQIFAFTKIAAFFVVLILISGFIILYLFPDDTERLFAWTIKPRMTPLAMGAGYAAGAFFFTRAILAKRWHHVGTGILPITVFSAAMGAATFLHWDRFNHEHITFTLWTITYIVTPFLIPFIWIRNQVTDPGIMEPGDIAVPMFVRWIMAFAGIFQLAVGLFMFFMPQVFIPIWPWTLTPLTARVIGGWFSLPGAGGLMIAREKRWSAVRITMQGTLIYVGLLLIGVWRAWSDFDTAKPLTWAYLGMLTVSFIGIGFLYFWMERQKQTASS